MLINVKSLVQESWKIYKNNLVTLIKISFWLLIPSVILSILPILSLNPIFGMPLNMFFSIVSLVLSVFISVALIVGLNNLRGKQKINLKEIYNLSYSKLISAIWVSILSFLVALLVMVISALPTILGLLLKNWLPAQGTILAICYSLSAILFIASSIALGIYLSFALYVVALEGVTGIKALYRSKDLVLGRFWPVLWRWFASYIIFGFFFLVVTLIPIYLIGLLTGDISAGFATVTPWWANLISNVIYVVMIPLFATVGVILYNNLAETTPTATKQE